MNLHAFQKNSLSNVCMSLHVSKDNGKSGTNKEFVSVKTMVVDSIVFSTMNYLNASNRFPRGYLVHGVRDPLFGQLQLVESFLNREATYQTRHNI